MLTGSRRKGNLYFAAVAATALFGLLASMVVHAAFAPSATTSLAPLHQSHAAHIPMAATSDAASASDVDHGDGACEHQLSCWHGHGTCTFCGPVPDGRPFSAPELTRQHGPLIVIMLSGRDHAPEPHPPKPTLIA